MTVSPALPTDPSPRSLPAAQAWIEAAAASLKPAARKASRELTRLSTPIANHVRKRPVSYAVGAVLIGAGLGLLINRKARTGVGDALYRSWDLASERGDRAADALRALARR